MSPKFSVIIPCLNEEKFLPHLLESLVHQSGTNFEVIVVDGSSKDRTVELARGYSEKLLNLEVLVSKKASAPLQRNLGAEAARGDWFVFIDADSIVLPYFIERIGEYIDEVKPAIFTTWFRPDSDVPGDAVFTLICNMFIEGSLIFQRPLAPGPLTIVDRTSYEQAGGYDNNLTFGEDYDFTQRVIRLGKFLSILRETLYVYSLRRIRNEGSLRVIQLYAKASLLVLLTRRNLKRVPGYIMGGHLYNKKKKPIEKSVLRRFEVGARKLIRELFD